MSTYEGRQFGKYRLTRLLGQGAFADVYLGEHIHLHTYAAIKVLQTRVIDDESLERFRYEARIIASLVHPNIVRVWDFDVADETPFLVMDYAPHGTLRQRYPNGSALPPIIVLPYVKQVAAALQYAHDLKLVHRDVKPENILLSSPDKIVLTDFGLVVIAQTTTLDTTREMAGTAAYMAPEQIKGKPRPASDQYSLAVAIYEWLSGSRLFDGSFMEIVNRHLLAPVPSLREHLPELSPAIDAVLQKALAKDAHERFPNVDTFATAFEEACAEQTRHTFAPAAVACTQPTFVTMVAREPEQRTVMRTQQSLLPATEAVATIKHQEVSLPATDDIAIVHKPTRLSMSRRFMIIALVGIIALLLASVTAAMANSAYGTSPSTVAPLPTSVPKQASTATQQPTATKQPELSTATQQSVPSAISTAAPSLLSTPAHVHKPVVVATPSSSTPTPTPTTNAVTATPTSVSVTPTDTVTEPTPTATQQATPTAPTYTPTPQS